MVCKLKSEISSWIKTQLRGSKDNQQTFTMKLIFLTLLALFTLTKSKPLKQIPPSPTALNLIKRSALNTDKKLSKVILDDTSKDEKNPTHSKFGLMNNFFEFIRKKRSYRLQEISTSRSGK